MTVIDLLDALSRLCEECLSDMRLPVRPERQGEQAEYRAPIVFKMDLPKKTDDIKQIPYILIQVLTGQDIQKPGEPPYSIAGIRFAVAVYCEDMGEGKLYLLNILTRLRTELLRRRIIERHFILSDKIDWAVDPRSEYPYYFGEMIMNFEMPPVQPDVPEFVTSGAPGLIFDRNILDKKEEVDWLRTEQQS